MNEKGMRKDIFEGKVIDAEEVIARDEAGLPPVLEEEVPLSPEEERALKRYKRLECVLGEGAFKKVYKAIDQEEGKEVAWNEVKITESEDFNQEKTTLSREIALLKRVSHPNILKIFDYWFTRESFVFITEMMTGGTLREYISSIGDLNIKLVKKWSKQILEGLAYLHSQNPPIIHRDIKCENIFVNAALGEVKIGDLGIAKEKRLKRYTVVGTPQFMAREMFEGLGYNEKVDMYAFGMCLIEMATGKYPYKECNAAVDVYKCILQGVPPVELYSISDPCLKNLILNCLVLAKDRISSKKALEHHFFGGETECTGDCVPPESMNIKPLTTPANDMEISLISYEDTLITFQLFFMCEAKFIKFTFDTEKDTVENLAGEMLREEVVEYAQKDNLKTMLRKGIERAKERKEAETGSEVKTNEIKEVQKPLENEISAIKLEDKKVQFPMSNGIESIGGSGINLSTLKEREVEKRGSIEDKPMKDTLSKDTQSKSIVDTQSRPIVDTVHPSNIPQGKSSILDNVSIVPPSLIPTPFKEEDSPRTKTLETIDFPSRKYEDSLPVEDFSFEAADITKRSQEVATSWVKVLKQNDILTVSDLRYLVDEDWDRLGLSVFICRVMKNMLYGVDKHPLKEKYLPDNPLLPTHEEGTPIPSFLKEIALSFSKEECVSSWEGKLLSQDIRTVGELKSLHQDDWDRLGLSVFSYRAIKNMIFKKGRSI